jgi:hypothetical protein
MKIEIGPAYRAYLAYKDAPKGACIISTEIDSTVHIKVIDSISGTVTAWIIVDKEELKRAVEVL